MAHLRGPGNSGGHAGGAASHIGGTMSGAPDGAVKMPRPGPGASPGPGAANCLAADDQALAEDLAHRLQTNEVQTGRRVTTLGAAVPDRLPDTCLVVTVDQTRELTTLQVVDRHLHVAG